MRYLKLKEIPKGQYRDPKNLLLSSAFNCLEIHFGDPWFKQINWFSKALGRKKYKDAKTMFKLYYWWTVVRLKRPVPFVGPCPQDHDWLADSDLWTRNELTASYSFKGARERYPEYYKWLDAQGEMEDEYEREDQAMLKRLINIRYLLWT